VYLNDSGQILIDHEHQLDTYRIRISKRQAGVSFHYEENMTRRLFQGPSMSNQFIFNVHFSNSKLVVQPPGMNIFRS
jgi:hypothetical protein